MNTCGRLPRRKLCQRLRKLRLFSMPFAEDINIPKRIERGPTEILKALKSTVGRDHTAAHYKYIDDPYLIPISSNRKNTCALSRESGRKTARWIYSEYAELFDSPVAEPKIPAFLPPEDYIKNNKVSEEILKNFILSADIDKALKAYKMLDKNVSSETKLSMLEMLCFYNKEDNNPATLADYPEARWYKKGLREQSNTWRTRAEITELFDFLIKQDDSDTVAAAYNAMICGMTKHNNGNEAYQLYKICLDKGIPICIDAYNGILQCGFILARNNKKRIEFLYQICNSIVKNKICPNVVTLNSILQLLSYCTNLEFREKYMYSVLVDFKKRNIQPSLATYYFIFAIINKRSRKDGQSHMLSIMRTMQCKEFTLQDSNDLNFFSQTMKIAADNGYNMMGKTLHDILNYKDNYKLIAYRSQENQYYHSYCHLLLEKESHSQFFRFYESIVPNVYVPEASLFYQIVQTLSADPNFVKEYLPRLLSDMVLNHLHDLNVVQSLLHITTTQGISEGSLAPAEYIDIVKNSWRFFQLSVNQKKPIRISILVQLMILSLHGGSVDLAAEIFESTLKRAYNLWGFMNIHHFKKLIEFWPAEDTLIFTFIFKYVMLYGVKIDSAIATKICFSLELTSDEEKALIDLCSDDKEATEQEKGEEQEEGQGEEQ